MNAIVFLWSHPRSMSTATERIMRERGDFDCLHEPFMYYYYEHLGGHSFPHFEADANHPREFDAIVDMLRRRAARQPVFAKDMAYYVIPAILDHPRLLQEFTHLFLVRDPRRAILSHYKLDPDVELDEIGLESQWRLYEWVRDGTDETPAVIEAETVQQDPVGTLGNLWQRLGVPFLEQAFHWSEAAVPADWQHVAGWHAGASDSTGIRPAIAEDEATLEERFAQAALKAPHLQTYLDHHWPFYERLKACAPSH